MYFFVLERNKIQSLKKKQNSSLILHRNPKGLNNILGTFLEEEIIVPTVKKSLIQPGQMEHSTNLAL